MLNKQLTNSPIIGTDNLTQKEKLSIERYEAFKDKVKSIEHLDFVKDFRELKQRGIKHILNCENLSQNNKSILNDFYLEIQAKGYTLDTIKSNLQNIKILMKKINKDIDKMTSRDLKLFFSEMLSNSRSESYVKTIQRQAVRFFLWLNNLNNKTEMEKFPEVIKWIGIIKKEYIAKSPEEVLNPEDIRKLAKVSDNPRDCAIHLTLFELGCRCQEFLRIKRCDVKFDKNGAVIKVLIGKSGKYKRFRNLRVISCVPSLKSWYEMSPAQKPEDPLWITIGSHLGKALSSVGLYKIVKRDGKLAEIFKKKLYIHSYRHCRCYDLISKGFTDKDLRIWFGWSNISNMPSLYSSQYGMKDVEFKILKQNGLIPEDELNEKEDLLKPKKCVRCGLVNTPTNSFCEKCYMALDLKTVMEIEEKNNIATEGYKRAVEKSDGLNINQDIIKGVIREMIREGQIKTSP